MSPGITTLPSRSTISAPAGAGEPRGIIASIVFPSISSDRSTSGASETPSMIVAPRSRRTRVDSSCASPGVPLMKTRLIEIRIHRYTFGLLRIPIFLLRCWDLIVHLGALLGHCIILAVGNKTVIASTGVRNRPQPLPATDQPRMSRTANARRHDRHRRFGQSTHASQA